MTTVNQTVSIVLEISSPATLSLLLEIVSLLTPAPPHHQSGLTRDQILPERSLLCLPFLRALLYSPAI